MYSAHDSLLYMTSVQDSGLSNSNYSMANRAIVPEIYVHGDKAAPTVLSRDNNKNFTLINQLTFKRWVNSVLFHIRIDILKFA